MRTDLFLSFVIFSLEIFGCSDAKGKNSHKSILYDHRPHQLNPDDYERACHIPKFKVGDFLFVSK